VVADPLFPTEASVNPQEQQPPASLEAAAVYHDEPPPQQEAVSSSQQQQQRQQQQQQQQQQQGNSSWLKKTLIGRTPSLPSSLGKKKHSFLKVRPQISVILIQSFIYMQCLLGRNCVARIPLILHFFCL
jgi:hypothetical protein